MATREEIRPSKRLFKWLKPLLAVVAISLLLLVSTYGATRYFDDRPVDHEEIEDHFKHGSTGGERGFKLQFGFGIPYWIWIAIPEVFAEVLPDGQAGRGYSSLGFIYEDDADPVFDLPIGTSMRRVMGIDRVYLNCALCHTGSLRDPRDGTRQIVLGMPSNTLDLGAFTVFLDAAAKSRGFRALEIMAKVRELAELRDLEWAEDRGINGTDYRPQRFGRIDSFIMKSIGVMTMRDQLLALLGRLSFIDFRTAGPGRVDTFNSPKGLLGFDMTKADPAELSGNADFPSIWNQKARRGMQLHWDGNQCSTDERNLSAGFGTGATPATLDKERMLRVAGWLWEAAEPPPFPPELIDQDKLATGRSIYNEYCWKCHGNRVPPFREPGDGGEVGTVQPIEHVGTDRGRLDSYTAALASAQNSLYAGFPEAGEASCAEYSEAMCDQEVSAADFEVIRATFLENCYPARFSHFRKTFGYANAPLDGIWLRAPYLHNGSVPDLRFLLEPSERRPKTFKTGYDFYDYENVGFVTRACCTDDDAAACDPSGIGEPCVPDGEGWLYDTAATDRFGTVIGNTNVGHEGQAYGTELPPDDKQALLEYLKTF